MTSSCPASSRQRPVGRLTSALTLASSLALGLGACEVPRPDGAYDAGPLFDAGIDGSEGEDAGYEAGGPVDTGIVTVDPDGGLPSGEGGVVDLERARLAKLGGYYLMRVDLYSTVKITSLLTANIATRVSYLLMAQVGLDASGKLVGAERFCHQKFEQACDIRNCTATGNVPSGSETAMWKKTVSRAYTVDKQALSGEQSVLPIGYDGSTDDTLPTTSSDARVYDTASSTRREGFQITAALSAGIVNQSCTNDTVTRFATSFAGTLAGTEAAPSLVGPKFTLSRAGITGDTLYSTDPANCDGDAPAETQGAAYVRFEKAPASVDTSNFFGAACPSAALWDSELRADAPTL